MKSLNFNSSLYAINYISRYKELCKEFNDLENAFRGNNTDLYDRLISKNGYNFKYFKSERFYRINEKFGDYKFNFQLTLHGGLVEAMIDVQRQGEYLTPYGRFDFIPEMMGDEFDRKLFNLPKYTSESDLKMILTELFSIYEDLKLEIQKLE